MHSVHKHSCQCQSVTIFNVGQIVDYYRVHDSVYSEHRNVTVKCGEGFEEKNCLESLTENR